MGALELPLVPLKVLINFLGVLLPLSHHCWVLLRGPSPSTKTGHASLRHLRMYVYITHTGREAVAEEVRGEGGEEKGKREGGVRDRRKDREKKERGNRQQKYNT